MITERPSWRPVAPDVLYRLTLTDPEGDLLLRADTRDTLLILEPDTGLRPGERYRWWVEALLPSGETGSTGAQQFSTR